jgi:hypothetical protein
MTAHIVRLPSNYCYYLFWRYLSLQFCSWWMSALSPICFSEVFLIWLRSFSKLVTSRVPSSIALRFFLRVDLLYWFSKLNLGYLQALCSLLLILVLSALFDNQWSVERQFLRPRLVWILFSMTPYQYVQKSEVQSNTRCNTVFQYPFLGSFQYYSFEGTFKLDIQQEGSCKL